MKKLVLASLVSIIMSFVSKAQDTVKIKQTLNLEAPTAKPLVKIYANADGTVSLRNETIALIYQAGDKLRIVNIAAVSK